MVLEHNTEQRPLLDVLLAMHRESEPDSIVRALLDGAAPLYAPVHAFHLMLDRARRVFQTATFLGTEGTPLARLRAAGFDIPESVEFSALWPVLAELAADGGTARVAGRLSAVLGDAWGAGRCIGIQGVLRGATVATAVVPSSDGPVGLFVMLAEAGWPEWVLRSACGHAAVALGNAFQRVEAQQYAEIDPETWVHNRRYLEEAATRELERAVRYGHELSAVVVEPAEPGMPRVMLRTLATQLARSLRTSDVVGRWSANRFVLLLAETDSAGALRVLQRLSETAGDEAPRMIAGAATFPADGSTLQDLLAGAGSRLHPLVFRPRPARATGDTLEGQPESSRDHDHSRVA